MGSRPRDPAPPREPGPQETHERGHATARRRDPTAGPGRDAPRSVAPTFPPGHRHRGAEGAFSAIPAPSEGTGGAGSPAAPPDPAEAPNQMNMYILIYINCTKRIWGVHAGITHQRRAPRGARAGCRPAGAACRAGSEIGKAPGAAHAGPGVLPGPAPLDASAPITCLLLGWEDGTGTGVGHPLSPLGAA